ncbi:hypothetical protein J5288_08415 [Agrobacterium sp. S2/73]|uniref:hypothetical protein n=1 Tax=unclassified Agrobacterium TaxID=2632611 RepID=UPI001ADB775F|nr:MULTISPECIES: hypothetical protein [unclassified Agrobacterium]MBO9108724.1 hypothetical protein [Agrobacterium sp. S2/73]QXZ73517.1 hypothetical protein J5276_06095 [Agrobacterium sp. S7/73]
MAVTKKENVGIELPKLDIRLMEVAVVGDSPLIVHAWSEKAKREMLDKQMKKAKSAKEAKDPVSDFEAAMYRLADGGYGFPSVAFKNAAVTAGTSVAGLTKIQARQAFHILGEDADIQGAFEGSKSRVNLVRIEGGKPSMREDMVRVGMGTADLRYRPEFSEWHAKLLVRYNANVLSESQILNLLNVAGFAVGVGEWRPEKDGQYGCFHVATEADIAKLEAA